MARYKGQPFLRLLECYVLSAIEQLDEEQQQKLEKLEPHLARMFSATGTWQEIVGAQMDFPHSFPETIRGIWEKNLARLWMQGVSVDPEEFARAFIDENFPRDETP